MLLCEQDTSLEHGISNFLPYKKENLFAELNNSRDLRLLTDFQLPITSWK